MIVYTQGSFDILHSGHINLLRKCRKLAGAEGKVIVAVLSDKAYKKYRGHRSAKDFSERSKLLESMKYVDLVIKSDNEETEKEIKRYQVDLIVVGTDWVGKDLANQYHMKTEDLNPLLVYTPYTIGVTSTQIKERIKNDRI